MRWKDFAKSLGFIEGLVVGIAAGSAGGAAIFAFAYPVIQSQSWAAWIQAIGSIGAILGAFFIANGQHRRSLEILRHRFDEESRREMTAEVAETQRILQAIRDEIEVRAEQFELIVGRQLDAHIRDCKKEFYFFNRMPSDPFPVYHNLLARIPLIENQELRQRIVRCYAVLESLVLTIETNSEFSRELQAALADRLSVENNVTAAAENACRLRLRAYFPQVREMCEIAREEIRVLLNLLP